MVGTYYGVYRKKGPLKAPPARPLPAAGKKSGERPFFPASNSGIPHKIPQDGAGCAMGAYCRAKYGNFRGHGKKKTGQKGLKAGRKKNGRDCEIRYFAAESNES